VYELMPYPFCGNQVRFIRRSDNWVYVACNRCQVGGAGAFEDAEEAARDWNESVLSNV